MPNRLQAQVADSGTYFRAATARDKSPTLGFPRYGRRDVGRPYVARNFVSVMNAGGSRRRFSSHHGGGLLGVSCRAPECALRPEIQFRQAHLPAENTLISSAPQRME